MKQDPDYDWDSVARRYVERDTTAEQTFVSLSPEPLAVIRDGASTSFEYLSSAELVAAPPATEQFVDVRERIIGNIATGLSAKPANDNSARIGDFMQTFSARRFWPLDARPDEVHIGDIAHALSLQCRYAGHCLRFYCVAEHSVLIARWLVEVGESVETALAGLMHDATEAYLVDMPRPVKRSMHEYRIHEAALWRVIAERYSLPEELPAIVHDADQRIIADELVNMRPMAWHAKHDSPLDVSIQCWEPKRAEQEFLATFEKLQNMRAVA
ncbi:MAG: hypothetical protein E5W44_12155 [Mesorhizobium sp.]|nr:MAG: hypothetical protein E5W44_12155 [Mesorhizobium sp.]